jgi:hypothetical protein
MIFRFLGRHVKLAPDQNTGWICAVIAGFICAINVFGVLVKRDLCGFETTSVILREKKNTSRMFENKCPFVSLNRVS